MRWFTHKTKTVRSTANSAVMPQLKRSARRSTPPPMSPWLTFLTWLSGPQHAVSKWWTRRKNRDHGVALRPLGIMPLEERRVLSASAFILADTLFVSGTTANETVTVDVTGTTLELRDGSNNVITIGGNPDVDLSDISDGLIFDLGDGDDVINLETISGLDITVFDDFGVTAGTDTINFAGDNAITGGLLTLDAETLNLSGDINASGAMSLTGAATLTADTTLDFSANSSLVGSLAGQTGSESLTVNANGANWIHIGSTTDLTNYLVNETASTNIFGSVSLSGDFTIDEATGTATLSGAISAHTISLESSDLVINDDLTATTGPLDITADEITIDTTETLLANAGINLQTITTGRTMNFGGATETAGSYHITEAEFQTFSSTGTITIGSATFTGDVNLNALDITAETSDLTIMAAAGSEVSILGQLDLGGNGFLIDPPTDVVVAAPIIATGAAPVQLEAINQIRFEASGRIQTATGTITLLSDNDITFEQTAAGVLSTDTGTIVITADNDSNTTGEIQIDADATFTTSAGLGNITLNGPVSSQTPGSFDLNLTAGSGAIQFNDTIGNLAELNASSSGNITFSDTVGSVGAIDLTSSGATRFEGNLTNITSLSTDAGGTTTFDTASANIGTVTISDAFDIEQSLQLTSTSGGADFNGSVTGTATSDLIINAGAQNIDFAGAVSTLQSLQLTTTGDITFENTVDAVGAIDLTNSGATRFEGNLTNITSLTTDAGGTTTFDTASASIGTVTINDAFDIEQSLQLTSTTGGADFNGSVTGTATSDLIINAGAQNIDFAGAVSTLQSLQLTSSGDITFENTLDAVGAIDLTNSGATRFEGNLTNITSLTTDAGGTTTFDTASANIGTVTINDAFDIEQSLTLTSTSGGADFNDTVTGTATSDLIINAGAQNIDFAGAVSTLQSLQLTTTGDITFEDTLDAVGAIDLTNSGATRFEGNLTNITSLTTDAGGTTTFDTASANIGTVTVNDDFVIEQDFTLTSAVGGVTFNDSVAGTIALDFTINAAATNVAFNSTSTAFDEFVLDTTGQIQFVGEINDVGTLDLRNSLDATITGDANNLGQLITNVGSTLTIDNSTFDANDDITIGGTLILTEDLEVTADNLSVNILDGDDNDFEVHLNTPGNMLFGAVSNVSRLRLFDAAVASVTGISNNIGSIQLENVTQTTFAGNLTNIDNLESDGGTITFDTASADIGLVTTAGSVELEQSLQLTSTTGGVDINGTVTGTAASDLIINAGAQNIDFAGAVSTLQSLQLTSSGDITFENTVDAVGAIDLTSSGATRFEGNLTNITSLTTDAGGTTTFDTASANIGTVTISDAFDIEQSLQLTSTSGGADFNGSVTGTATSDLIINAGAQNIDFAGAVSTLQSLQLTSSGDITLGDTADAVGAIDVFSSGATRFEGNLTNIMSLSTDAGGTTTFDTASANIGTVTMNDALTTEQSLELTSTTGGVSFNGSVTGAAALDLTIQAAATNVAFNSTLNDFSQVIVETTGQILLIDQIEDIGTLDLRNSSDAIIRSDTSNLGSLITNFGSTLTIDNSTFDATGDISVGGTLVLTEDLEVTADNLSVHRLDGDSNDFEVHLNSPGAIEFGQANDLARLRLFDAGTVTVAGASDSISSIQLENIAQTTIQGNLTNIGDLESDGGTITFDTASANIGLVTIAGDVELDQSLELTSTTGGVEITGTVAGVAAADLVIDAGNQDIDFAGAVSTLQSLQLTTTGDITLGDTVGSVGAIDLTNSGATRFEGNLTNITSLTTDAGGTTTFDTASANIGTVTINDAFDVEQSLTLTSTTGGVDINGSVTGTGTSDLIINAGAQNIEFASAISTLQSLQLNSTGTTRIDGNLSAIGSLVTDAGGTTVFNTGTASLAVVTFNDAVVLEQSLELTGTGNITFADTLFGDGGGESIQISTPADLAFDGAVQNLQNLQIDNAASVTFGDTVVLAGTFTQTAGSGTTQFDGAMNVGALELTATEIVVNAEIVVDNGTVDLTASDEVVINATVDSRTAGAAGDITVQAGNRIGMTATGALLGADEITLDTLGGNILSSGVIEMADGAVIASDLGPIDLQAGGSATVTGINSGQTTGTAINLFSQNGAILDGGNSVRDLTTAGDVVMRAATGIGAGNAIETEIASVTATNVTSGNIELTELSGLSVTTVNQSGSGDVLLATSGGLLAVAGGTGITSAGGDVTLDATGLGSEIQVSEAISTAGGDLNLLADGAISSDADGTITTTAGVGVDSGNVTIESRIAGNVTLEQSVSTLGAAEAAGGDITVTATSGRIQSAVLNLSGGAGAVNGGDAGQLQLTSGSGNVELNGAITAIGGTGATAGVDGAVSLSATDSILDTNDGNTLISAGSLSAVAGNAIGEITDFAAGTGNALDLELSDQLTRAEVMNAAGTIHLRGSGDLELAANSLVVDSDGAADAIVGATGALDVGSSVGAIVASAGDRVQLIAGDVLTLPDVGIDVGATGQLRLSGGGDIVDVAGRELGLLTADELFFESGSAGGNTVIETAVNELTAELTAAGAGLSVNENNGITLQQITTNNGEIDVDAALIAAGDISLVEINAGSAQVSLDTTANGGGIVDADETVTDVVASALAIRATTGVAAAGRLEIDVTDLAINTSAGDVNVLDVSSGVNLAEVDGVSGVQISGGTPSDAIDVRSDGSMTVNRAVVNQGGGDVTLAAFSAANDAELTVSADVAARGGDGQITLASGASLGIDAGAEIVAENAGQVIVTAGENRDVTGGPTNGAVAADLTLDDGTVIRSDDGPIDLRASGDLFVSTISANGDNDSTVGSVTITADFDGVDGGLSDGVGAVVDNTAAETANVTADMLTIAAATGIGASDDLETSVASLSFVNSTSGNVQIFEVAGAGDNGLTVNAGENQLGLIDVRTEDGQLDVNGPISTTGSGAVTLIAGDGDNDGNGDLVIGDDVNSVDGTIALESAGNDVVIAATGAVNSSGVGNITVDSGTVGVGEIQMGDGAVVSSGTGTIALTSPGDVTVGQIATGSANLLAISVQTDGAVIDAGDVGGADFVAEAGRLNVSSDTGFGAADAMETAVGRLSLINTTSGAVNFAEATGLLIDELAQNGPGDVNGMTNGTLTVAAGGSGVSLNGGTLNLEARGAAADLVLGADVTTQGGAADLRADRTVSLGAGVELTTQSGEVTILADDDGAGGGDFLMAASAGIDAAAGDIGIQAGGQLQLTNVITEARFVGVSTGGAMTDAGDLAVFDVSATEASLSAMSGIGAGNAIETSLDRIAIVNDSTGAVAVNNIGNRELEIGTVGAVSGIAHNGADGSDVTIFNDRSLTISSAVTSLTGGDLSFTAISGLDIADVTVNAVVDGNGGIVLNAERDLLVNDTGSFVDIVGASIAGDAGRDVTIANDVIIQSGTGAVIQSTPLLENIVTPQVLADGSAQVTGDFGRLNELNFAITVDWADGTVETFQRSEATPSSFLFEHQYFGNPDPVNPAADIPITVSIADDPNIIFREGGNELTAPPIVSFADVPGEGLAGGSVYDLSVDVPELGSSSDISIEIIGTQTEQAVEEQEQDQVVVAGEDAEISEERIVKLRILNASGDVQEEITLKGDEALRLLNDFVGFVEERNLPDGQYQILQQEPGDQMLRIVFDLLIRDGKPADSSQGLQDRPPTDDGGAAATPPADPSPAAESDVERLEGDSGAGASLRLDDEHEPLLSARQRAAAHSWVHEERPDMA